MTAEGLRRTPLYERHRALGARIVPFAGWEMPVQYEGIVKEHTAVRERAGLFDVSHMGEMFLRGPRAIEAADRLVTNHVAKLEDGKALYTVCLNERGTILDDLIVYRIGPEEVLIVVNASNVDKIVGHFRREAGGVCEVTDASDETALLALQGPRAADVARAAGAPDAITGLGSFRLGRGRVGGVDVTAARTGYTGEDGFELFCRAADAPTLWDALLQAGQPHGIAPAGLGARDTLRLEARLCLYGNDIDETTNPLEAGLGWVVKLGKGDFVGKDALVEIKAAGLTRKLVGFEMVGRGIGRHGYPIVDREGREVGVVTSGSPAPTLDKNIGLGYVPAAMSEIGTPLGIRIRDKVIDAVVVKTPFYKREK